MACILNLNLRNPVSELEKPSHPLHEPWFASLALLREFSLDRLWRKKECGPTPSEQGYLGVDENEPDQAMYIFQEFSEKQLSRLKRSCESEHSALSKNLSPLLKEPLSLEHLTSFSERLKITYADNYKIQDQYLEFLKVQWSEPQSLARLMSIGSMLEDFKSISSHDGRGPMPVLKYSTTLHDSGMTSIYCIEWRSFEHRDDVLANPGWRRNLKDSTEEERKVVLQKWNKTDETITPEEELSLFFLSIGARGSDSQLVRAKLVNAAYFGWSTSQATQRPKPCNIL